MNVIRTPANTFPPISAELLKELETRFPDQLPTDPCTTVEELRIKQGEMNVVRLLRRQFDAQNKTIIKGR